MSPSRVRPWLDRLAHDLRGPLSPMQTAVYLLRDPGIDEDQRTELLTILERQVRLLGGMIDELSDLARVDAERLVARRVPMDIGQLLTDTVARLQARPPHVVVAAGAQGMEIEGDVLRIAQLFHLLLGLQLSRNDPAGVQALLEPAGDSMRLTCTVHCLDASDELATALLASPHPDPPDEALGLGLVIAAAIASAHGGRLHGRAGGRDRLDFVLELPRRTA